MSIKGFNVFNENGEVVGVEKYDYNSLDNLPDFESEFKDVVIEMQTKESTTTFVVGEDIKIGDKFDILTDNLVIYSVHITKVSGEKINIYSDGSSIPYSHQFVVEPDYASILFCAGWDVKVTRSAFDNNGIAEATMKAHNESKTSHEDIRALISALPKFTIKPVDALPTSNIDTATIYLLRENENSPNLYTEYIYVNGAWEILGIQKVDLSGYLPLSGGTMTGNLVMGLNAITDSNGANLLKKSGTGPIFIGSTDWMAQIQGVQDRPTYVSKSNPNGSFLALLSDVTTLITTDATSGAKSITLTSANSNNEWRYVYASGITSLTLASSGSFANNAEAYYGVVFISGTTATTITNTLGAYFTGDDCVDGVFTPILSKKYDVGIWWNGLSWQAVVRGV